MVEAVLKIEETFTRKVWKKLRENQIPIVPSEKYSSLASSVEQLNQDLSTKHYFPTVIHGHVGIQKGAGVTRFLPVLTAEDMAVYYHICYTLAEQVLVRQDGVFGAWHQTPKSMKVEAHEQELLEAANDEEARGQIPDYFSDPFKPSLWIKEWRIFNELILELASDASIGNYVVQTDIANFYDSIEIPRLMRSLRRDAPKLSNYVETLEVILGYWNRRNVGYGQSTKGIPQEIISDASRILSHYYLQRFDSEFRDYCDRHNLTYVRWADDVLIFGMSRKALEGAVHVASRELLQDGLNLNAAKTKFFSKRSLLKYRGIAIISAIGADDARKFRRELKKVKQAWMRGEDQRLDSIFRASVGYVKKMGGAAGSLERSFLLEVAEKELDISTSLNARQMTNLIAISDVPKDYFRSFVRRCANRPYGGPKATILLMLRKHRSELASFGVNKRDMLWAISEIEKVSSDSTVMGDWCIPAAKAAFS